jgi:hypothetical protein
MWVVIHKLAQENKMCEKWIEVSYGDRKIMVKTADIEFIKTSGYSGTMKAPDGETKLAPGEYERIRSILVDPRCFSPDIRDHTPFVLHSPYGETENKGE